MRDKLQNGFSLLEIVVAISIIAFVFFALVTVARLSFAGVSANTERIQAIMLLEETIEAVRILRDESWTANMAPLTLDTPYYLEFTSDTWQATSTSALIDNLFTRSFMISAVERDGNDDIVSSGGTVDVDTKRITTSVSWSARGDIETISLSGYITNLFLN